MRRAYWRTIPGYEVQCRGCAWRADAKNAKGLAAQHHDRTGHVVQVIEEVITIYGEDHPGQYRWWKAR